MKSSRQHFIKLATVTCIWYLLLISNAFGLSAIELLTQNSWQGKLFFIDCYFRFTIQDQSRGLMLMGDEFGNEVVTTLAIMADDRFIDNDHQDFTIVSTKDGFDLISTHLPPVHLTPYSPQPPKKKSHPTQYLLSILSVWSLSLLPFALALKKSKHIPNKLKEQI